MLLKDIYDQLAYGELRELKLGGSSIDAIGDGIASENHKRLLPHIQMGLTSLHTKCALKEGTLVVPLVSQQTSYLVTPAAGDLIKIERVYGVYQEEEYEIPLNQIGSWDGIRTPSYNSMIIPSDTEKAPWLLETTELVVKYRADHPAIDVALANASPRVVTIELPSTHLEALCYFIASRLHNPIGMTPGAMHEGNNYAQKYEIAVAQLNSLGLQVDQDAPNERLYCKGFP
jgi:hypothetical protein